ncbi:DNRLRE domain-containing protein [Streptosporangium sp. NPDC001559]|uniref:DNRLRE domain-containing protein n=1 Tax=Streptosporangium sp. NPDC001559 TaxID=3366187 RepID=UPI0036E3DA5D
MLSTLADVPSQAQEAVPVAAPAPAPTPEAALSKALSNGGKLVRDDLLEGAKQQALTAGKRVGIPSLSTETSKVWANPDGRTLHAEISSTTIQVKDKSDRWSPVDTTLTKADGSISPRVTKLPLQLSTGGTKQLVTARHGKGVSGIGWGAKLPAPILEKDTAVYTDAIMPGADLTVTALPDGFVQNIVLRRRPAKPISVRLPLTLPKGMRYGLSPDGRPQLLSEKGEPAATPVAVQMVDAAAELSAEGGHSAPASAKVEQGADGPTLVVEPDPGFLSNQAVQYPVTMTVQSDWTGAALQTDTFISNIGYPYSQTTATWLRAGKSGTGTETWRTYLRFIVNDTDIAGAKILNADLRLWNYRSNTCGSEVGSGIVARQITTDWSPSTLTWSNQPSVTTSGQYGNKAAYSDSCSWGEGELYYSIEDIVQGWAEGIPDYGLQLRAVNESEATNWRQYRSSESTSSGRGPILFVDYEPSPSVVLPFAYDQSRSDWPTYDEAVSMQIDSETSVPVLPGTKLSQIPAIQSRVGAPYEVNAKKLQPLPGEDWDAPGPENDDDALPPVVADTSPAAEVADVALNTTVTATFSEPVWDAKLSLKDPVGTEVPGTSAMDTARKVLTFTPGQPLLTETRYTATVSDASDGYYNVMAAPYSWSFNAGPLPSVPTVSQLSVLPSETSGTETVASSLVPSLQAKVDDANERASTVAFEVEHDPAAPSQGSGLIWSGSATGVAAGSVASVQVPSGQLANGYRVRWRARATADSTVGQWSPWQSFTVDPPKPKITALDVAPAVDIDGGQLTSSLTPELQVWGQNPMDGTFRVEYEVEHDPAAPSGQGTGSIWTGAVNDVAGGERAEVQIPTGALSDGWKVRWRARAIAGTLTSPWSDWQALTVDLPKPDLSALDVSPSTVTDGVKTVSSLTPELWALAHNPLTGTLRVEYEVEHDPAAPSGQGTGSIWTGAVNDVASNSTAKIQIPTGKLTNSWKVRWRARAIAGTLTSPWSDWQALTVDLPKPDLSALDVSPSTVTDGVKTVSSLTPELWALAHNPLTGTLRVEYEVEHDPAAPSGQGTGSIWTGAVNDVASNSTAKIQIPTGKLTNSWKVRWRARAIAGTLTSPWSDWQAVKVEVPKPFISAFDVTPASLVDGVLVTSSDTPLLNVWPVDALGRAMRVEYQFGDDPDVYGQESLKDMWSGATEGVQTGDRATIVVPPSRVTRDRQTVWRARVVVDDSVSPWSAWQKLEIDLPASESDLGEAPGIWSLRVTPSTHKDGTFTSTSRTPEFETFVDTEFVDEAQHVEYQLEHDPTATGQGTGSIWSTTLPVSENTNYISATVPANTLTDGWKVRWRARLVTDEGALTWTDWLSITVNAHDLIIKDLDETPSQPLADRKVVTSLTPDLYVEALDPASTGSIQMEYEIRHDPAAPPGQGTGSIWSTSKNAEIYGDDNENGWAQASVPAGTLSDGWRIQWRTRAVTASGSSPWTDWIPVEVNVGSPVCCDIWALPQGRDTNGERRVLLSTTPTLEATFLDLSGASTGVEFQIEHDPAAPSGQGAGLIWSTSVNAEIYGDNNENGWAQADVPAGTLTDGWQIRWRARSVGAAGPSAWSPWSAEKVRVTRPVLESTAVRPSAWDDETATTGSLTPMFQVGVYRWESSLEAHYEVQVEHDPQAPVGQGSGLIWSVTNTEGTNWVSMPEGLLQDGWKVRWRVRVTMTDWTGPWIAWQPLSIEAPKPRVSSAYSTPQRENGLSPVMTPYLRVTATDPEERASTVEYQLEHDPDAPASQGTGLIWSGNQTNVCSRCESEVQIPSDLLSYGWKVRWRARAVAGDGTMGKWSEWQKLRTVDLTVGSLGVRSAQEVDGQAVAPSLTPLLDANVKAFTDEDFTVEFQVEHDPAAPLEQGSGSIWSGNDSIACGGCWASVEVPNGKLGNAWQVRWRARAVTNRSTGLWSQWQSFRTPDLTVESFQTIPSTQVSGETVSSSVTPDLAVHVNDESERTFSVDFQVEHAPEAPASQGAGPIWTGTATGVCSTCSARIEIPAGELEDGWKVRWRARALTGDVAGPWSGWQTLKIDVPDTTFSVVPKQAEKSRTASKPQARMLAEESTGFFPYERLDLVECNNLRKRNWDYAYNKEGLSVVTPYTGCWSKFIGWGEYKFKWVRIAGRPVLVPIPVVKNARRVEATVVVHTYAGNTSGSAVKTPTGESDSSRKPREIAVWTRLQDYVGVYNWKPTNLYDQQIFRLDFEPSGGESPSCKMVEGKNRRDTIAKWKQDGDDFFLFRSEGSATDTCTLRPWLTYENAWWYGTSTVALWNRPEGRPFTDDLAPVIRCDSEKRGAPGTFYTGGCIFVSANPVLTLYTGDTTMTEAVDHNKTALYYWGSTNPKRNSAGQLLHKKIPGNINAPSIDMQATPLTFLSPSTKTSDGRSMKGLNKTWKDRECARMVRDAAASGNPISTTGKQCDEYPYASTYEGAGKGDWNFSLRYIPTTQNRNHGNYLKAFYARYRIIDKDQFWVKIVEGVLT